MPFTMPAKKPNLNAFDFGQIPFIVIWEMTRSCALRCVHCRAEAIEGPDPSELTTDEAFGLLREIRSFARDESGPHPLVVLTGGDPMRRTDALRIVEYGTRLNLRMTMTPSGTDEMSRRLVSELKEKGLARLAVSLDGSYARLHDSFRKVAGSFKWTMDIIRWANEFELPLQINTTITRHNWDDVREMGRLLEGLNVKLWSVFFLVPTGRGRLEDGISGQEYEKVFNEMYALSKEVSYDIKSTEAPHYRRVVMQKRRREGGSMTGGGPGFLTQEPPAESAAPIGRSAWGVNAGNGFVFVSHTGEIYPSGFLPLSAGNVREDSLVDVYRHSPLFQTLRDESRLKGKCGVCEYRSVCGGSRSRTYAVTGDYMASDPFCVYVPKSY